MAGTIKKRAKGSYTIWWDEGRDPLSGKRRQRNKSIKGTKRNAEAELRKILSDLDSGDYIKPNRVTLGDFLEKWLTDYVWPNRSPETAQGYQTIVRKHLIPGLGGHSLHNLQPEMLQAYYAEKLASGRRDGRGGLSPRTVRHHHTTLHTALQSAVKWKLLTRNPVDSVDPPQYQRQEMKTFDESGLVSFLEYIQESEYYPLFYTFLYTGLRRAEALAIRWQDIDLVLGQISVNRTLHHLEDKSIQYRRPKTPKSRRMIALTPTNSIVLRDHYQQVKELRTELGIPLTEEDLVFAHVDGSPLLPSTISHVWARLTKRAGFKSIRLHDARHSHVSLMLKQGVDPKTISERLGHSSVVITLDTYAHLLPGMQEAAARGFDEGLSRYKTVPEATT